VIQNNLISLKRHIF